MNVFKSYLRFLSVIFLLVLHGSALSNGTTPDWTRGAIWYQIVPERFRNLNPSNDPIKERVVGDSIDDWQAHPWASDFHKLQIWEEGRDASFEEIVEQRRYGGDLIGVMESLNYLKNLGVDVILLNPVFEASSVLKYDAVTFHHIDNNFGAKRKEDWEKIQSEREDPSTWTFSSSDEVFLKLIKRAHKLDIRIVIEAQFTYCSNDFWAFKDLTENQQDSPYRDWFDVLSWDDPATPDTLEFDYKVWQGNKEWPLFKQDENGLVGPVKKYILEITRRWMRPVRKGKSLDGIDGWYVSSARDIQANFWREWLEFVKSLNPAAVTVSEYPLNSNGANDRIDFDLFMNHDLSEVIKTFFVNSDKKWTVSDLDSRLQELRNNYSESENQKLITRLGNQSTIRLASLVTNPDMGFQGSGLASNGHALEFRPPDKEHLQTLKLISLFWLTYVGSPMIFYGDENGMWGGNSPCNLKPKFWPEFLSWKGTPGKGRRQGKRQKPTLRDRGILGTYIQMTQIRAENPAIRTGSFETILVDAERGVYAFSRKLDNNEVLVFINTSDEQQTITYSADWERGAKFKDLLTGKKIKPESGEIELQLDRKWGAILTRN